MSTKTIWMYDEVGSSYHDGRCKCDKHCGNCYADLDQVRAQRDDMIARKVDGYTDADRLSPRARYCSPYCQGVAKRYRATGRNLASVRAIRRRTGG